MFLKQGYGTNKTFWKVDQFLELMLPKSIRFCSLPSVQYSQLKLKMTPHQEQPLIPRVEQSYCRIKWVNLCPAFTLSTSMFNVQIFYVLSTMYAYIYVFRKYIRTNGDFFSVCSFTLLKHPGYVMHQQFNIQQLYVLSTLYLCVLYLSENKQRLVPLTA